MHPKVNLDRSPQSVFMKYILFFAALSFLPVSSATAQNLVREIALLNLAEQNSENNDSQLFSAEQMLRVAGIPFRITTEPSDAINSAMVLCSSELRAGTLSDEENLLLEEYVSGGGVLIVPRVLDEDVFPLFGFENISDSKTNYIINWNTGLSTSLFRYIDEPEEWSISLGRPDVGDIFRTYAYGLAGATALAHYDDGSVAVSQNIHGSGAAYAFGMAWKDVILRSQLNRDYEAQRISSNGFEPTQDMLMLLMRTIFCEHVPHATWTHTSPANSTSTVMLTHDIDSGTAVDTMLDFATSETESGIAATYNVTLRYFSDALMGDFYLGSQAKINSVMNGGHVIGSHSVGHFFDFADDDIFPFGSPGNTMENYLPHNNGDETTGGTVFGECEVSKNVLEADHGIDIRSFRAGHLAYHKYLVDVLDSLGYLFNSSNSANDVLTNFPYQNKKGRSFNGERSEVYEFPVSISDVFHDDPISMDNYLDKADTWQAITRKIDANHGSTVLLIHPNRGYKLLGQEYYISNLPQGIHLMEMNAFGDYWKIREAFAFATELVDSSLYVTISTVDLFSNKDISLVINQGQALANVIVQDENGNPLNFISEAWGDHDLILHQHDLVSAVIEKTKRNLSLNIYPNPTHGGLNLDLTLQHPANVQIELLDLYGKLLQVTDTGQHAAGPHTISYTLNGLQLSSGMYICKIHAGRNGEAVRKLWLK